MSHEATIWAWSRIQASCLAANRRLLLLALAECHNRHTGQCNPSLSRLHEMTGMKRHTIAPAIRDLEAFGLVRVLRTMGNCSEYQLLTGAENGTSADSGTSAENGIPPVPKTAPLPVPKTAYKPGTEPGKNQESTTTTGTRASQTEDKQPAGASAGGHGRHEGEPAKPVERAKPRRPIPDDWQPGQRCRELLEQAGIGVDFALSLVGEFVLYWQERGDRRPGWDATFLNHAKAQWTREKARPTGGNVTPLRPLAASPQSGSGNFRTFGEMRQARNVSVVTEWATQTEDYIDARSG